MIYLFLYQAINSHALYSLLKHKYTKFNYLIHFGGRLKIFEKSITFKSVCF